MGDADPDLLFEVRTPLGFLVCHRRWELIATIKPPVMRGVTKQTADQAFLVTAYPTDAIKEGTRVWPK